MTVPITESNSWFPEMHRRITTLTAERDALRLRVGVLEAQVANARMHTLDVLANDFYEQYGKYPAESVGVIEVNAWFNSRHVHLKWFREPMPPAEAPESERRT